MISKWQRRYRADPEGAFKRLSVTNRDEGRVVELERMVGQLTMENAFLKKVLERLASTKEPGLQR